MTGISYITNETGKATHVVLDMASENEIVRKILEDLKDIQTLEKLSAEKKEGVSIQDLRKEIIEMGVPEKDLMKIPDV